MLPALKAKAEQAKLGHDLGAIAVVLDTSKSMEGHKTQKMRPAAASHAMRDVLAASSKGKQILCGNQLNAYTIERPEGSTNLARALIQVMKQEPDTVFVLSDGYENEAAGRFADVVDQLRGMGIDTPIYHINPVMAAENKNVRKLAADRIPTLAVSDPKALETGLLIPMLEQDPKRGLLGIYHRVQELIG